MAAELTLRARTRGVPQGPDWLDQHSGKDPPTEAGTHFQRQEQLQAGVVDSERHPPLVTPCPGGSEHWSRGQFSL